MTPRLSEVQQIYVSINFWILFRRLFWGVLCAAQHATGQVAQSRGHSSSCVASRSMDSNGLYKNSSRLRKHNFQFTTNVVADYNVHIYYYFGYYFYTLLAVWAFFSVLLIALAKAYSLTSFGSCGWLFERLGNVYDFMRRYLFYKPNLEI